MTGRRWYRGNIHAHTSRSDGDASPDSVIDWYRRHGYDFLVLSDRQPLTLPEGPAGTRCPRGPLLIPGEEVSVRINEGRTAVHINAIGISRLVRPACCGDVVSTLQANVDAVRAAGGIACINHPNYTWAFDHRAIAQVTGASLLEVFNGHPWVNQHGAPGRPSCEEIWDGVLGAGKVIFGVATDDSHHYKDFASSQANPGRGWVVVRAEELTAQAIVEALASGEFYASTGVVLAEVESTQQYISVRIEAERDFVYATSFLGRGGVTCAEVVGAEATYVMRGDEGYVRAVVKSSCGPKAWTQPVVLGGSA